MQDTFPFISQRIPCPGIFLKRILLEKVLRSFFITIKQYDRMVVKVN